VSTRLRVAVVGPGGWGRQHVRIFSQRPDTELVAVVGRDPQRTAQAAAWAATRGFTDLAAMLDTVQPDLVSVCLPNEHHFAPTLQLVRTGVPLLVEKPLVFDLDEADRLLDEAGDRFFAINFNHRYAEPIRRTGQAIRDGRLGALNFALWRFGGEANLGTHPHANLIETQCHAFDTLEHLCGPIASVCAQATKTVHRAYTTVALALQFVNGAVGTLLGTYDSSYAYPMTQYLEVNGSDGRALVTDTVKELTLSRTGSDVAEVWQAGYFDDTQREFHRTFDRHVDDLLRALRAGNPPPVHARAGRRALHLAMASIESFETGRRVDVDPEP
jgi:predicted dehydrogenase